MNILVERYTALYCGPCRLVAPLMEEIKTIYSENENVTFVTIDVDENPERASEAGVRSIPLVVVYRNGEEKHRFAGVQSKNTYVNAINAELVYV